MIWERGAGFIELNSRHVSVQDLWEKEEKARARQGEPWALRYLAGCGCSGSACLILCGFPGTSASQHPPLRPKAWLHARCSPFRKQVKGSGGREWGLRMGASGRGALCGSGAGEVCSRGQDRSRRVPRRAPWLGGVSRPGVRAQTRWISCVLWPQAERSGLPGAGGLRRGGQPDIESVRRTLRSEWCLGCYGRRSTVCSMQCVGRGGSRGRGSRPCTPPQGQGCGQDVGTEANPGSEHAK